MKRNSTITSNSSSTNPTAPISFAAAAQKNTTKTPAAAPTPTPPQQQSSQQPPSAPQAAAPQQTPPRQSPVKPSTANGNYSSVAAKANANAANRRSQPPTAAAAVKGQPAKPATPSAAPIQFGSINNDATESAPAETAASDDKMTFGSIPASKKAPSVNETPEVEATPEAHNTHRRTDSTSSAHSDPNSYHHRPQGVPTSGAGPNFTRPPVKNHHPQGPHHGMHPGHQHPQWNQNYYMPQYDPNYYQQQQMYQQMPAYGVPSQRQPIPSSRPFNTSAPAFTPQAPQPSKRIAIINPDTKTEVKPLPSVSSTSESKLPVVIDIKNPEDEKKDIVTPPPAKNVIKIVNPADREREEKERKEKEEKARKEQEEKERLEREEKERLEREAKEAEERRIQEEKAEKERLEALARAEQERKEKEERERKEKEEREEKERLEAEQKKKEEEERIAREKAEAETAAIAEKARLEKEKAELEAKEKLEAERRIALETEKLAEKVKQEEAEKEKAEKAEKEATKAGLTVDVARTVSAPAPLSSARIENFGAVSYPTGIQSPINADPQGKFRYNRDFLMQFMSVCTDKPESLPSLEALGMDESDRRSQSSGGSQRGARGPVPNGRKPTQPMGSFNLGSGRPNMMGSPMGGRTMSNEFNSPRMNRSPSDNQFLPRNNNLSRPPSQRGSRGGKRGGGGGGGRGGHHGHQDAQLTIPIEDIVPLEKTDNAWTPNINASKAPIAITAEETLTQEQVARKVKGLLNKLTLEKFDSISDKVIDIANLSTKEADGTTLKHCIQIIFEKATDEPNFGSVYARLCQKLMDKVSDEVKDNTVQGSTGGKLFRKYLLHRCQEEFVKGWKDKAAAGGASLSDKDGPDLMSDEYYIMMKAKRQGLGLIHFIGELFKLQMLTEKIMHECVKKLLANVKDPEEEETEGLCKLMTTVGLQLDRPEAKAHMDVYFARMTELTRNLKLASRIRFMVQDVIDLRANKWVNRRAAAGPKTIAAIHEEAARQQEEKELMRRTASSGGGRGLPNRRDQLSRGQSFRGSGDARNDVGGVPQVGADGWSTVGSGPTPPKKAGDLSSFGNTARSKVNGLPSLGPGGSVFGSLNKTKRAEKAAPQPESNRNSTIGSANIFAALEGDSGDRRGSVDEKPVERRRLNLLPRSTPVAEEGASTPVEKETPKGPKKTEEEAKRSIENTLKEYLSIRDMTEMVASVAELDDCYRPLFVTEFVNQSMEMKQSDIDSIADIFKKLAGDGLISKEDFEAGFADPLEFLPDTAIDVPNAYKITAQLLEAAGLDASKAAKP